MGRNVFWLMPTAEFHKSLLRLIMDLAGVHDAPVFAPHVSLGATRAYDELALEDMRARVAGTALLELETAGIETGSDFPHSLFMTFAPSDMLDELMAAFPFPSPHQAHLSLLYCPPEKRDVGVCDAVEIPFSTIKFDQVWVVPMTGVVRTGEDVTRWQASERMRLSTR